MPGGRAGTPGASYERTRREHESQEDREATLDRQRLRTNHLKRRQRWVPQLVYNKLIIQANSHRDPIFLTAFMTYDGYAWVGVDLHQCDALWVLLINM